MMQHQTSPSVVSSPISVIPYPSTGYEHRYSQQQNIDDLVYRYSAESDRGIPKVGIYSQDGLWDEDETSHSDAATTIRPSSGSTFGASKSKAERNSVKSRSRSGTMASGAKTESGMWGAWGRKMSTTAPLTEKMPNTIAEVIAQSPPVPPKELEKKKSKSLLKGKGRRGELSVDVSSPSVEDGSLEAPPPLPSTPASFMTNSSPALSGASMMSPPVYPSRLNPMAETVPAAAVPAEKSSAKSSWRRGMQKLFKSKSSVALREAFTTVDVNRPPVPEVSPRPHYHPLGKPFSSTPPMPSMQTQRDTNWSIYSNSPLSPPPLGLGVAFGSISHPSLPADPFASSLDMSSNTLPASATASPIVPPKARLNRNSPSLRDLKQFFVPAKPRLSKAKSMANIRQQTVPTSAPPDKVEFTPIAAKFPKRVNSVIFPPASERRAASEEPKPTVKPRPVLNRIATDSPPLLPPRPSYFPCLSSYQLPVSTPGSPLSQPASVESPGLATGPPPSTPLPALPASAPLSPIGTTPIKRSGSGAVLLPRSRSTSMSLKAPPTSSSFFDLYEQLGIWPTPSEKDTSAEASPETSTKELQPAAKIESKGIISESTSTTFSVSSWEAAISAFPIINDAAMPKGSLSMDFGQPHMMDQEMASMAPLSPMLDEEDGPDTSFTSHVAVGGSTCSLSTGYAPSQRVSTVQASSSRAQQASGSNGQKGSSGSYFSSSRKASGSRASSGSPSRDEQRPSGDGAWFDGASAGSSRDSSDDEDDKPLSALHPEAAAVQRDVIKRKESKRAAKARAKGRNPGGDSGWDGEGGVPADTLSRRLQTMMLSPEVRIYNWQLAQNQAMASSSSTRHRAQTQPVGDMRHASSLSKRPTEGSSSYSVNRSHTARREEKRTPTLPSLPTIPSPVSATFPPIVSPVLGSYGQIPERHVSSRRHDTLGPFMSNRSASDPSRQASSSASSTSHPHHSVQPMSASVTRSNTAATSGSSTRTRSRAISNAASTPRSDDASLIPQRAQQAVKANAFVGGMNGTRIHLDLYPETTPRDVLSASLQRGELNELGQGLDWVVVESFAELGYERQVREYESLQAIVKGWDTSCRSNCFILRQSNSATTTWTRAIPLTAPFVGGYVQYETKKGKWSKRFLETRGGQVFVSKNDKNKEEFQINTLFHDVFTSTRSQSAPKPFVFVLKRLEPASAFENPSDYLHVFSAEESIGWKLAAAIFDAKSHAIAQTRPQLLASAAQPVQRRPTVKAEPAPLIDLKQETVKERQTEKSGFTGKGLLRF